SCGGGCGWGVATGIHRGWAGLVGVTLYSFMFLGTRLYADTVLQVFFFATGVRGWWQWRHGGSGGGDLPISELSATARAAVVDAVASRTAIAGFVFTHFSPPPSPYPPPFLLSP